MSVCTEIEFKETAAIFYIHILFTKKDSYNQQNEFGCFILALTGKPRGKKKNIGHTDTKP